MLPITGPLDGNLPNHHTMVEQTGLRSPPAKTYQNMEFAKSNLVLAQNIQVSRADLCDEARIGPTANILSATRLPQLSYKSH